MPGSFLMSSRLALTTLPPKTGHFSIDGEEHAGHGEIDAEDGFAGDDVGHVNAARALADDLVIAVIFELDRVLRSGTGSVAAAAASSP